MLLRAAAVLLGLCAVEVSTAQTRKVVIVPLSPAVTAPSPFGEDTLRRETVRAYLDLTHVDEIYRQSWLRALESKKTKGAPYWPQSFWDDVRKEMTGVDLSPMVLRLYAPNIRDSQFRTANEFLKTHSISELAASPEGSDICRLQAEDDKNSPALTLEFTQTLIERVYAQHRDEIKAAREKYLREHPDYKE